MDCLKLDIETNGQCAEEMMEFLNQFGALSVSIAVNNEDGVFDISDNKHHALGVCLTALLHVDTDLDILLICLRNRVGAQHIYSHRWALIDQDHDWVGEFKSSCQPLIFSDRLKIVPSWLVDMQDGAYIILDPGLAFGTGSHPTTALCLEWLVSQDITDRVVIDYGCGSGILSLAAASLGAKSVYAIDIDPQAIRATKDNAQKNKLDVYCGHEANIALPQADIILANIVMQPLKNLVSRFADHLVAGGHLILSGILHVQVEECLKWYTPCFDMSTPVFKQEWARLLGVRRP